MNKATPILLTDQEALLTIEDASLHLLFSEAFYGHIISGINKKISKSPNQRTVTQIHSLGATTVTVNFDIPKWSTMLKPERAQRLKKETLHYIFMHPWAVRPADRGFFYTACDLSANKYTHDKTSLREDNFDTLCKKYKVSFTMESWETIYTGFVALAGFIHSYASEDEAIAWQEQALKGEIMNGTQATEAMFYLPQGSKGNMNLSEVHQMVEWMKCQGATQEEITEAILKLAMEGSDPWESVSQGTSDLSIRGLITTALKDSKSRGDVPAGLASYIDAFLAPPKIDWKHELRKFTSLMGNVVSKTTMTRRNKRFKTFPATKIRRTQRVAIIGDTSGSVSDEEFEAFFAEMAGILQDNCEIIFIHADADVDHVDIYKSRMPNDFRVMRCGGGGTAFGPALEFVRTQGRDNDRFDNIGKVDGTIYMTDGYAPAPAHENYPMGKMLWITTSKPVIQMESEGFEGKIIFLDWKEDDKKNVSGF